MIFVRSRHGLPPPGPMTPRDWWVLAFALSLLGSLIVYGVLQ